jgi:hypothetical protein
VFGIVRMPIGMPKEKGNPFLVLEPRLAPPLDTNLDMGIKTNVTSMLTLATLI